MNLQGELAALQTGLLRLRKAEFDEGKHPRDPAGRFSSVHGTGPGIPDRGEHPWTPGFNERKLKGAIDAAQPILDNMLRDKGAGSESDIKLYKETLSEHRGELHGLLDARFNALAQEKNKATNERNNAANEARTAGYNPRADEETQAKHKHLMETNNALDSVRSTREDNVRQIRALRGEADPRDEKQRFAAASGKPQQGQTAGERRVQEAAGYTPRVRGEETGFTGAYRSGIGGTDQSERNRFREASVNRALGSELLDLKPGQRNPTYVDSVKQTTGRMAQASERLTNIFSHLRNIHDAAKQGELSSAAMSIMLLREDMQGLRSHLANLPANLRDTERHAIDRLRAVRRNIADVKNTISLLRMDPLASGGGRASRRAAVGDLYAANRYDVRERKRQAKLIADKRKKKPKE